MAETDNVKLGYKLEVIVYKIDQKSNINEGEFTNGPDGDAN